MTANITIPAPFLSAGMHFKVRYRELPAGSWINLANQTNAPFSITGLTAGSYELEAILVMGSTECPATRYPFGVRDECPCLTGVLAQVIARGPHAGELQITYDPPLSEPACGWIISYGLPGGPVTVVTFQTLPASLSIPVTRNYYEVKIEANCCEGNTHVCYEELATLIAPECEQSISAVTCWYKAADGVGEMRFELIQQTTPPTTNFTLSYLQTNMQAGAQPDSGTVTFTLAPGQTVFTFPIKPSNQTITPIDPSTNSRPLTYKCYVTDNCKRYEVAATGTYYL